MSRESDLIVQQTADAIKADKAEAEFESKLGKEDASGAKNVSTWGTLGAVTTAFTALSIAFPPAGLVIGGAYTAYEVYQMVQGEKTLTESIGNTAGNAWAAVTGTSTEAEYNETALKLAYNNPKLFTVNDEGMLINRETNKVIEDLAYARQIVEETESVRVESAKPTQEQTNQTAAAPNTYEQTAQNIDDIANPNNLITSATSSVNLASLGVTPATGSSTITPNNRNSANMELSS